MKKFKAAFAVAELFPSISELESAMHRHP
jgi:hypothetical protein